MIMNDNHKLGDIIFTYLLTDPHVFFILNEKHMAMYNPLFCIEYSNDIEAFNINNWFKECSVVW